MECSRISTKRREKHCKVAVAEDDGETIPLWTILRLQGILQAAKYKRELRWFPKERIFDIQGEEDFYKQKLM